MAHLRRRAVSPWVLALLALCGAGACSPGFVAADSQTDGSGGSDEGSGGADGTGGADAAGGTDGSTGGSDASGGTDGSGGSTGGRVGSGGSTGGSDTGSGGFDSACEDEGDTCVPAANFDDQCFSPGCSAPVAATESEVAANPCLVHWDERESEIPEQCAAHSPEHPCPAVCEVPPPCVDAICSELTGECEIVVCLP